MMNELNEMAMENVTEAMENVDIPNYVAGRGFNKRGAVVVAVTTTLAAVGAALWKNRGKIAEKREQKQIAKFEKKGYTISKVGSDTEGQKTVVSNEESK